MDISRKTTTSSLPSVGDQEDWDLEILQAMVSPSTAEDAALACAATWMNFVRADRVAVAIFDSPSSCIVAHGQRDDSHLTIYVGHEKASASLLLKAETLYGDDGPCTIENPTLIMRWPEHLSAILICVDDESIDEERLELVKKISRKLLSRWTTPATAFADPAHMESVAEFSAGAGHEINNPLGSIIGQTQLLLKREERADHRQALETIGAQAWRIRDMIGDAMLFARPPQPEFTECDLVDVATKAVTSITAAVGETIPISLQVSDPKIVVFADSTQLSVLLTHLLRNACEAVREIGRDSSVLVEIRRESDYAASIVVQDNGKPIPDDILTHMFDPFYSGRQAGRGLGFGLCHSWQIVRMHNGILTLETRDDGNRFYVFLPVESAADVAGP